MIADSKSEATWRGFFMAAVDAGVGAVIGMIAGFIVGGLADAVVSTATGHEQLRFAYVLAEAGTYLGLFVGIVVGIGAGAASTPGKAAASSNERTTPPSTGAGVNAAWIVEQTPPADGPGQHDDNTDRFGGAAAA
jgi:hypothetical protein